MWIYFGLFYPFSRILELYTDTAEVLIISLLNHYDFATITEHL